MSPVPRDMAHALHHFQSDDVREFLVQILPVWLQGHIPSFRLHFAYALSVWQQTLSHTLCFDGRKDL